MPHPTETTTGRRKHALLSTRRRGNAFQKIPIGRTHHGDFVVRMPRPKPPPLPSHASYRGGPLSVRCSSCPSQPPPPCFAYLDSSAHTSAHVSHGFACSCRASRFSLQSIEPLAPCTWHLVSTWYHPRGKSHSNVKRNVKRALCVGFDEKQRFVRVSCSMLSVTRGFLVGGAQARRKNIRRCDPYLVHQ